MKMFYCFIFRAFVSLFVNVLIETDCIISDELNLSDVSRSVNYTGSLAKFT